jgi:hypothetical protein
VTPETIEQIATRPICLGLVPAACSHEPERSPLTNESRAPGSAARGWAHWQAIDGPRGLNGWRDIRAIDRGDVLARVERAQVYLRQSGDTAEIE